VARSSLSDLIRKYFAAYENKDRAALESTLREDFTFTSPKGDHIDRETYLIRCWPNAERTKAIRLRKLFEQGDEAFVLYDLEPLSGDEFRNTEFFTGEDGKIKSVEVYFGSDIGRKGDLK
jgi:ketosteroid isomerase-like protein